MVFNRKPQFELHRTEQQRQLAPQVIPLTISRIFFCEIKEYKSISRNFIFFIPGNSTIAMDVTALTQAKIKALTVLAEKLGCSLSQLAIAW